MNWFYADGGAQKGPVNEEQFQQLVQSGTIKPETLVWREGMAEWRPCREVAPAGPTVADGPPPLASAPVETDGGPAVVCSECRKLVPSGDTVVIDGRIVCASCKPYVVQRMIEGTGSAAPGTFDPDAMLATLASRGGYQIEIGSVVSRAFDVVRNNFWPAIGVTLLVLVILGASAQVPCIGPFIQLAMTGPLMGGLYLYFLIKSRGRLSTINDAFSGFRQPLMKELMLASLIIQGIVVVAMIVMIVPMIVSGALQTRAPGQMPAFPVAFFVAMPLVLLAVMYVTLIWTPAYVIIADTGIGFWKAMELSRKLVHQRFFTWILVYLVMMGLGFAGALALCVGVFFVMPMIHSMQVIIWDDIRKQSGQGVDHAGVPNG